MIEVHLYGGLRRHASDSRGDAESILNVAPRSAETVRTLLERVGIDQEDLCHVFLNGSLLTTRNTMAPWLEYQQAESHGLDSVIHEGDRLGLFAQDMALLVV